MLSGLGVPELLIIVVIGLLLFAPSLLAFGLGWILGSRSSQRSAVVEPASEDVGLSSTADVEADTGPEADSGAETADSIAAGEDSPSHD
ncbi:MAG: twin-arginine translocase TatA/TatE family subunit [Coriobacteriales bacterium]|nr:twin-arginine translocase TatA/TatE family subunit [Coriobacteriales bacterium]